MRAAGRGLRGSAFLMAVDLLDQLAYRLGGNVDMPQRPAADASAGAAWPAEARRHRHASARRGDFGLVARPRMGRQRLRLGLARDFGAWRPGGISSSPADPAGTARARSFASAARVQERELRRQRNRLHFCGDLDVQLRIHNSTLFSARTRSQGTSSGADAAAVSAPCAVCCGSPASWVAWDWRC